jgi:hypothetical protein
MMHRDDCARLVNLVVSTWPSGVKGHVWTEALIGYDYDLARAAYVDLRDSDEKPPSVARFIAAYHRARTAADESDANATPFRCALCDGTGLVSSPPERAHNPRHCHGDPCFCTATEACRCSAGKPMIAMIDRIIEHNGRNRRDIDTAAPPPDWRQLKRNTAAEQAELPL